MNTTIRKHLLIVEFVACYWHVLAALPVGIVWGVMTITKGGILILGLVLPGALGLIGVLSMLIELLSGEIQLPRLTQVSFTGIGILLSLLMCWQLVDLDKSLYGIYFFFAPVVCAVHFLFLTHRIHTYKGQKFLS